MVDELRPAQGAQAGMAIESLTGAPLVVGARVPFCAMTCSHCAEPLTRSVSAAAARDARFTNAEIPGGPIVRNAYPDALRREFASILPDLAGRPIAAMRIWGGMPNLCPAEPLARLVKDVCAAAAAETPGEVTANKPARIANGTRKPQVTLRTIPGGVSVDAASSFKAAGVDRFEFGVETCDTFEWYALGRPTALSSIDQSLAILHSFGFSDFGASVMFGIPGQTERSAVETLSSLADMGLSFFRLHRLPLVPGTRLHRHFLLHESVLELPRHDQTLPTDEQTLGLHAAMTGWLLAHGYSECAPESGVFALPGHEDRYEQALATGLDHVELGCGGVSVLDDLRTVNVTDPVAYTRRSPDPAGIVATVEDLSLTKA